jgi:NAD(P)H-hydrate epimerase
MVVMVLLLHGTCSTMATSRPYTTRSRARTSCTRQVNTELFLRISDLSKRLKKQLEDLKVPFTEDFPGALKQTDHVVDAIFGFSFSGEVREPFPKVIEALESTSIPVLAVDAPSSWNIEEGPPNSGPGKGFMPPALISLTAPKPLVKHFKGRHFLGGRFLSPEMAEKYGLDIPKYEGLGQVVEVSVEGGKL